MRMIDFFFLSEAATLNNQAGFTKPMIPLIM